MPVLPWWTSRRQDLLALAEKKSPLFLYNEEVINENLFDLLSLEPLEGLFYPVRWNPHRQIIEKAYEMGVGFLCTTAPEIRVLTDLLPKIETSLILFAPERRDARGMDRARKIGAHVATGQNGPWKPLLNYVNAEQDQQLPRGNPANHADRLKETADHLGPVKMLRFGDNLCLRLSKPGESAVLDPPVIGRLLEAWRPLFPDNPLWLDPGPFLIASAGAWLTTVMETRHREEIQWIRVDGDLQSLFGETPQGVSLSVENLSRETPEKEMLQDSVVLDTKSHTIPLSGLVLPKTEPGDRMIFTNTGAYETTGNVEWPLHQRDHECYVKARRICQVPI
jgi:diaminopimelate decarboxylase/aspartate kinase